MQTLDVLADPNRRRIVELLADGPMSAGSVAAHFEISRPAVSQHLGILVEADVLTMHSEGTRHIYAIRPAALLEAGDWLTAQATRWGRALDALETRLDQGDL